MNITALAHVCIKTTDLDKTAGFYCDTLGLQRLFDFTRNGKVIGFYMKAGNLSFVEVFLADEVDKIDRQVLSHFCLETDGIEALRQRMVELGHTPGEVKMGADNSYQFWMKDPNGMDIEFHQYTEKSSQFTGKSVEVDW